MLTELKLHKKDARFTDPTDFVFATRNRTMRNRSNVTRYVLKPAIGRANETRAKQALPPIVGVTNHSLRRTYVSLLYAAGHAPDYVMQQMGHESASLALEVYSKVMARKPDDGPLDDLVAVQKTRIGSHFGSNGGMTPEPIATPDNQNTT